MSEGINIFIRNVKWRFQNPITIIMTLIQPIIWLVIFSNLFANNFGDRNYIAFILPGILVMGILSGASISGIANYSSKSSGAFYRITISPVNRGSIILGHILDVIVLSTIQSVVLSIIAFIMSVRINTGILGVFLIVILIFITVFFVSSLSYVLSMLIPDENSFIAMVNTLTLPLFFLSTALLEKSETSNIFKIIMTINPFSYVVDSFRNLIVEEFINWRQYGISICIFLILGVIAFIFAKKSVEIEV